jgi:hypothetical protein
VILIVSHGVGICRRRRRISAVDTMSVRYPRHAQPYFWASSASTVVVSSRRLASASTAGPRGVPRALQGARRTWGSRRIRFTFQESARLNTSRLPLSAAHHTGTETGVPSRLKVVMLTKGSVASAALSMFVHLLVGSRLRHGSRPG